MELPLCSSTASVPQGLSRKRCFGALSIARFATQVKYHPRITIPHQPRPLQLRLRRAISCGLAVWEQQKPSNPQNGGNVEGPAEV